MVSGSKRAGVEEERAVDAYRVMSLAAAVR